jgi:hypothetical protein
MKKYSVKVIPINKAIAIPEPELKTSCLTERISKPDISVEFNSNISRVVTVLEQGLELNRKQYELFLELSRKTGNKSQEVAEEGK